MHMNLMGHILNFIHYLVNFFKFLLNFSKIRNETKNQDNSNNDIEILHYSDNFLVVNKSFDILINSNDPDKKLTVHRQLLQKTPELINSKLFHDFNFIHRLDYATSGVLCLPTHKGATRLAGQAFRNHETEKFYVAIVRGLLSAEEMEIRLGIGDDVRYSGIRMAPEDSMYVKNVRSASTKIFVLQYGLMQGYPATKLLLKLITGRRHQLRVHLSWLGHTIAGDFTYSNKKDNTPHRMFLHAYRLVLPTPLEHVDVTTLDPFTSQEKINDWKPIKNVKVLNEKTMDCLKEKTLRVFTIKS